MDFDPINPEVPPPDAQVVLTYAWHEWKKDVVSMSNIYSRGRHLTFDQHWWCFRHFWDWARFWAVRHTDPEARAEFVLFLQQYDEAGARIVEKARDHLRKHGLSETQIEQGLE